MPNLYDDIPAELPDELFQDLLAADNLRIARIVSKGHSSPAEGWYEQAEDEWVILLQGAAELAFEDGRSLYLSPGDHLHIPARQRHRVAWTTPEAETIWLAVHFLRQI